MCDIRQSICMETPERRIMTDRKQQNKETESNEKNPSDQQVDPEAKLAVCM